MGTADYWLPNSLTNHIRRRRDRCGIPHQECAMNRIFSFCYLLSLTLFLEPLKTNRVSEFSFSFPTLFSRASDLCVSIGPKIYGGVPATATSILPNKFGKKAECDLRHTKILAALSRFAVHSVQIRQSRVVLHAKSQ